MNFTSSGSFHKVAIAAKSVRFDCSVHLISSSKVLHALLTSRPTKYW
jgi:hypothetical protein